MAAPRKPARPRASASKAAPKGGAAGLLARINAALFSETHIEECRAKFSALSDDEFVIVMRKAVEINADPLKGDIYLKQRSDGGYNAIATIACMRAFAQAQGDYAGDDQTISIVQTDDPLYTTKIASGVSVIVVDPARVDRLSNPAGIVFCSMGVYRHIKGEFRRHAHTVAWDDYVPMFGGKIAGEAWANVPFVMIQKVAEVGALRKAYSELGSIYIEEEMDQAGRQGRPDLGEGRFSNAPVEKAPVAVREPHRPAKAAAPATPALPVPGEDITVNFLNGPLTVVPVKEFADRIAGFLQQNLDNGQPQKVIEWFEKNLRARQDFYHADAACGHQNAMRVKRFYDIALRRMSAKPKGRGRRAAEAA